MTDSATMLPTAPPLAPRELARLLPELSGEAAIRTGGIPTVVLPAGDWRPAGARRRRQVILVAEGLVAWRTSVVGAQSVAVTGPGDVLLPHGDPGTGPVPRAVAWRPLTGLRLAVIEERILAAAGPELTEALLVARGRAATTQSLLTAATRIARPERRLLTLLWLVAEHWGRGADDGVHLDLALARSLLSLLAGSDPTTVDAALRTMRAEGRIRDGAHGAIVLQPAQLQALQRAHTGLADGEADALDQPVTAAFTG